MRHPNLPGQPIVVAPDAVAWHLASGWVPGEDEPPADPTPAEPQPAATSTPEISTGEDGETALSADDPAAEKAGPTTTKKGS